MAEMDVLIRTKLRLPFTRPGLVTRPRLQEEMARGLGGPLTLITAPAGFGKTVLAASCMKDCGLPAAWLSLDRNDNQLSRFLSYLLAALQEAEPGIGQEAAQLAATARQALPEAILSRLVNDLDACGREIALVLDDYQFISSQEVHSAVSFLLEHCPPTFHLVIASRSDPPLPLARLRACGQVVELRAADLRFSEAEAGQFLNEGMGLRLEAAAVAALAERTEGWIAGLQMASIALQSHLSMGDGADTRQFITGFSGTNRYILDYLLEEVLAGQPPEVQHFLLYTSVLERLSAPLCAAVLGGEKLAGWQIDRLPETFGPASLQTCQQTLEYLERANLFLVALDDERTWYRYHQLFADLLRSQLQKAGGDGQAAQLHLRAAAWHEQNGTVLEAIHHASLAANDELVERLIRQNYLEMMNRGEMSSVRFWMGNLSKEVIRRRPWLCLYEAMNRSWFGELEEATALLDEAEKGMQAEGWGSEARAVRGYHAYVKSRVTAMLGDTRRAIEYSLTARRYVPAASLDLQIDFSITLGYEYFLYGDFAHASEILNETIRLGQTARAINNPVAAYCLLARAERYQGHLRAADQLLQKAAQLIEMAGGAALGAAGLVEVERAALLCERNDLTAALAQVKRGLEHLPWWGKGDDFCLAYGTLRRIQLALGNRAEAAETVEKAARLVQASGVFSEARAAVEAAQVGLWLEKGDWPAASRWAAELENRFATTDPFRFEDELAQLTRARVWLAQDGPERALAVLALLEVPVRSSGRQGRLIEILILKALAQQQLGRDGPAQEALAEALALAGPGGYLRLFLDEGRPMQRLLAKSLAAAGPGTVRDYTAQLLSHFDARPDEKTAGEGKAPHVAGLVETLSQRELEVLRLMAQGQTNQEIARQLVVSPGTVKAHSASIYRKLDVGNRTEAAARARQLGLLP